MPEGRTGRTSPIRGTSMKAKKTPEPYPSRMVEEHLKASKAAMKTVLAGKESARRFLLEAGILDRKGNLAKPYR